MPPADPSFMAEAIALSLEAMRSGKGGPYGAVVVKAGVILGRGMNEVTSRNDPTHHADGYGGGPLGQARPGLLRQQADTAAAYDFNSTTIYEELAKPHDQRQLPLTPLMAEEALAAFEEWAAKSDKTS